MGRSRLLSILIFVICCGCFSTVAAGEAFAGKVAVFRAELGGYQAAQRPDERYEAGRRINAALLDILREDESLTAKPGDLLGGDAFALRFGEWVGADERQYRLVIMQPYESDKGAMTAVFCQGRAGDMVVMAEKVHVLTQTAHAGSLVYAAIIRSGNALFLPIVEVHNGPEDKYASIYTRRLENGGWHAYMNPFGLEAGGQWTIRNGNRSFSITHPAMGWDAENDYEVRASQGDVEIRIVAKDKTPVDSLRISFVDGAWVVRR